MKFVHFVDNQDFETKKRLRMKKTPKAMFLKK
jgi:hypothetical protein